MNIWRTPARGLGIAACMVLGACASAPAARVVLLAPFEGRSAEVGYNALYAARLAFDDASVVLLPVDDGGSTASAADRIAALASDNTVRAVVALGSNTCGPSAAEAAGDLLVVQIGTWCSDRSSAILHLSSPEISTLVTIDLDLPITETAETEGPIIGADALALENFAALAANRRLASVMTSGMSADPDYITRYVRSGLYVPQPNLLAMLTTDTFSLILSLDLSSRDAARDGVRNLRFVGAHYEFLIKDHMWVNAPLRQFSYDASGRLTAADDPIEKR